MKKTLLCLSIIMSLFCLFSCSAFNISNPLSNLPLERDIKETDVSWLEINNGTSSVTLNFTAEAKIKTITITVSFLDKNEKIVYSNTKSMTDLIKGNQYSLKFGIDFFDFLKVTQVSYKITSGIVDLT